MVYEKRHTVILILLSFLTLGIFDYFYVFKFAKDMNKI